MEKDRDFQRHSTLTADDEDSLDGENEGEPARTDEASSSKTNRERSRESDGDD
jgi:hypothetical protein